jgi:hypothetical protein
MASDRSLDNRPEPSETRRPDDDYYEYEEELSLRPLVLTLWAYRGVIAASVGAILVGYFLWAISAYLFQPAERRASLEFRLTFDGADQGTYPNGLAFSPAEIIATPILTKAYEINGLDRYCSYEEFKNSIFTLESNIAFVWPAGASGIPDVLMTKVLNDILVTWADEAVQRKGVLSYDLDLLSLSAMLVDSAPVDHVMRLDILHEQVKHVIRNVEDLSAIPGSRLIRAGDDGISLTEVHANLENITRYSLDPLAAYIWANPFSGNLDLMKSYIDSRLFRINRDRQAAMARGEVLQQALSTYTSSGRGRLSAEAELAGGLNPPVDDSFVDRIITLDRDGRDVEYRQELTDRIIVAGSEVVGLELEATYYERMDEIAARALSRTSSARDASIVERVESELRAIQVSIGQAVEQTQLIFVELSNQNLNPRTSLFTTTSPFVIVTERAVTLRSLAISGGLVFLGSLMLVLMACLMHHYMRRQPTPDRRHEMPVGS